MTDLIFEDYNKFHMPMVMAKDDGKYVCKKELFGSGREPYPLACNVQPIIIAEQVHTKFCDMLESWKRPDGHYWYQNAGFLLGRNEAGEILMAAELGGADFEGRSTSCASFININNSSMTKAVVEIAKANLNIAGFARVCSYSCHSFSRGGFYWNATKIEGGDYLMLNYQPTGPEFFRGDDSSSVHPYQIKKFKHHRVSAIEQFEAECVDTVV